MTDYLNNNREKFNIKDHTRWTSCAPIIHYVKSPGGSLEQYRAIILNKRVKIWLYNGDSDRLVPL